MLLAWRSALTSTMRTQCGGHGTRWRQVDAVSVFRFSRPRTREAHTEQLVCRSPRRPRNEKPPPVGEVRGEVARVESGDASRQGLPVEANAEVDALCPEIR